MQAAPGNVLDAGGNVSVARNGRVAVTVRSEDDYTSVRAAGDLVLSSDCPAPGPGLLGD